VTIWKNSPIIAEQHHRLDDQKFVNTHQKIVHMHQKFVYRR
jgi:hypothetical protein